jgi:hypothetical protein
VTIFKYSGSLKNAFIQKVSLKEKKQIVDNKLIVSEKKQKISERDLSLVCDVKNVVDNQRNCDII